MLEWLYIGFRIRGPCYGTIKSTLDLALDTQQAPQCDGVCRVAVQQEEHQNTSTFSNHVIQVRETFACRGP